MVYEGFDSHSCREGRVNLHAIRARFKSTALKRKLKTTEGQILSTCVKLTRTKSRNADNRPELFWYSPKSAFAWYPREPMRNAGMNE